VALGDLFGEITDVLQLGVDGYLTDRSDVGFTTEEDVLGDRYPVSHPQAKPANDS